VSIARKAIEDDFVRVFATNVNPRHLTLDEMTYLIERVTKKKTYSEKEVMNLPELGKKGQVKK